jgi:hypothetical protein
MYLQLRFNSWTKTNQIMQSTVLFNVCKLWWITLLSPTDHGFPTMRTLKVELHKQIYTIILPVSHTELSISVSTARIKYSVREIVILPLNEDWKILMLSNSPFQTIFRSLWCFSYPKIIEYFETLYWPKEMSKIAIHVYIVYEWIM